MHLDYIGAGYRHANARVTNKWRTIIIIIINFLHNKMSLTCYFYMSVGYTNLIWLF